MIEKSKLYNILNDLKVKMRLIFNENIKVLFQTR